MRGLFRWVFLAALAFTSVMALLPHPPQLPGEPDDKFQHILAFAVLGCLALTAWPRASRPTLLIALLAYGALIEVAQAIPALHRDSDWRDWLADGAALLAVALLAWVVQLVRKRRAAG